jgi:hypothetical protein
MAWYCVRKCNLPDSLLPSPLTVVKMLGPAKQNGWNEHAGCDSGNEEDALLGCALRDGGEMAM